MKSKYRYLKKSLMIKSLLFLGFSSFATKTLLLNSQNSSVYYSLQEDINTTQAQEPSDYSKVSFRNALQNNNINTLDITFSDNSSKISFMQAETINLESQDRTSEIHSNLTNVPKTYINTETNSVPKNKNTTNKKLIGTFTATAYDASVGSTTAIGINVKGKSLEDLHIIAVDPKVIPLRTKVYAEFPYPYEYLNGVYLAADTGSAIKGNKIDVYWGDFGNKSPQSLWNFGVRQGVKIYSLL